MLVRCQSLAGCAGSGAASGLLEVFTLHNVRRVGYFHLGTV